MEDILRKEDETMKTNSIYKTSLLTAALLLAATSCVKDELHDTPHPDTGKITVTADWTDRGDGVDIPAEWTVTMGDYTGNPCAGLPLQSRRLHPCGL